MMMTNMGVINIDDINNQIKSSQVQLPEQQQQSNQSSSSSVLLSSSSSVGCIQGLSWGHSNINNNDSINQGEAVTKTKRVNRNDNSHKTFIGLT